MNFQNKPSHISHHGSSAASDVYKRQIWDGLFWKFIKDNESFFRKQYRLAMLTRNLDKMSEEKLNNHLKKADKFLRDIQ